MQTRDDHVQMRCQECAAPASGTWRGWRAYRTDEPGTDDRPGLAYFCPSCAVREFGAREQARRPYGDVS